MTGPMTRLMPGPKTGSKASLKTGSASLVSTVFFFLDRVKAAAARLTNLERASQGRNGPKSGLETGLKIGPRPVL